MSTALDIITRACKTLGVIAQGEQMTADDSTTALDFMNQMMFGFNARGIDYVHEALELGDLINCPPEQEHLVMYMLVRVLAPTYTITLDEDLTKQCESAETLLQSWYTVCKPEAVDNGLRFMPSFRWGNGLQ